MVLPGRHGPRHVRQGLAVFSIRAAGDRFIPQMLTPIQPILQVAPVESGFIDMPTDFLPRFMGLFGEPCLRDAVCRDP
eukprot:6482138-Lingulodinium_polyedra.AAC.1